MADIVNQNTSYTNFERFSRWLSKHWLLVLNIFFGIYVITPILAPVFMASGWELPGRIIYKIYSYLCHQLPQRSYFLFGPKISYSLAEIQSVWQPTNNVGILRQFVGNPQTGWKIAWSDRMVSMYSTLWLFGILWGLSRKKDKHLPLWGLLLFLLPMAIDGTAHTISDFKGIGMGFRDSNAWLAVLTGNRFPALFYAGDAWGSFNAWMRLISGIFFGIGIVLFGYPYLNEAFINMGEIVDYKVQSRRLVKNEKKRLLNLSPTVSTQLNNPDGKIQYRQEGKDDHG